MNISNSQKHLNELILLALHELYKRKDYILSSQRMQCDPQTGFPPYYVDMVESYLRYAAKAEEIQKHLNIDWELPEYRIYEKDLESGRYFCRCKTYEELAYETAKKYGVGYEN